MIANGHEGTLIINFVQPNGEVSFMLTVNSLGLGPQQVQAIARRGFWDEAAQAITLQIVETSGPNDGRAITFEGWQFQMPVAAVPGQDVTWHLTGVFTSIGPQGLSNARRQRFGWHATQTQTL